MEISDTVKGFFKHRKSAKYSNQNTEKQVIYDSVTWWIGRRPRFAEIHVRRITLYYPFSESDIEEKKNPIVSMFIDFRNCLKFGMLYGFVYSSNVNNIRG